MYFLEKFIPLILGHFVADFAIQTDSVAINKCPNNIFKLLLLERKMNRQQAELYKNFSIISIFNNMETELLKIDKYQYELAKLLTTKDVCMNLDKFINKYKET